MRKLENAISAWREAMSVELPAETVLELEGHLRDSIAALAEEGMAPEAAFAQAEERLGDGRALAREFSRHRSLRSGSIHSRGARFMAITAGTLGLVAALVYTPLIYIHIDRFRRGAVNSRMVELMGFNLAQLFAFIVLGAAVAHASIRFLRTPTARDGRILAAYNLLIVGLLTNYAVFRTGVSYWIYLGAALAVFAGLACVWRAWAKRVNETEIRGAGIL